MDYDTIKDKMLMCNSQDEAEKLKKLYPTMVRHLPDKFKGKQ